MMSRDPAALTFPVLSFPIFQKGRRSFHQVSEVKEWVMESFKGH